MCLQNNFSYTVFLLILTTALAPSASAGMFDDPKNLKALAEDISRDELRATMRSFAGDTGSRCSTCHVGEVESDLRTYDFSADDKEQKHKARKMIKMVNDINRYLKNTLDESGEGLVQVNCATCHRGQAKPEMIQNVLESAFHDGGLEEAVEKYRDLRDRYYGGFTFDFSEKALMIIAEKMGMNDELDAALGFLALNLEFYPDSARTFVLQARALTAKEDFPAARASFLKALAIEPDNNRTQRMLDALPE